VISILSLSNNNIKSSMKKFKTQMYVFSILNKYFIIWLASVIWNLSIIFTIPVCSLIVKISVLIPSLFNTLFKNILKKSNF
jgi:hypothetical protein